MYDLSFVSTEDIHFDYVYIRLNIKLILFLHRPKESIVPSHQMEGNEIKPARAAPPKPTPYHPHRPPPSVAAPILPLADPTLSNGMPPVPGRKPPPSGPPPPLPPRVDLGEVPEELVSSVKKKSSDDFTTKGSSKLKYELTVFNIFV